MADYSLLYMANISFAIFVFILPFLLPAIVLRLPLLNPFTILLVLEIPIFFAKNFFGPAYNFSDGLFDPWFNYSLFVQSIYYSGYVIVFFFMMLFFNRVNLPGLNSGIRRVVSIFSERDCSRFSFLFFLLSLVFLIFLTQRTIGFLAWASDPRLGYQFHRVGNGHFYALSIFFASIGFVFLVLSRVAIGRLFVFGLVYCAYSYLYGSKLVIFQFFTFFLISLWFYRFRYFKMILAFGGGGAFVLMLINYGSFELEQIFKYFDYHVNSAMFYKYLAGGGKYFDGQILMTGFWEYVPRAFYPEKPFAYGDILIREIFWPGAAENTHTPGMAGPVGVYGDFGIFGVFIFSFLQVSAVIHAFCVVYSMKNYHKFSERYGVKSGLGMDFVYLMSFSFVFAPCFLMYIPFPVSLFLIMMVFLFVFFCKQFFRAFSA